MISEIQSELDMLLHQLLNITLNFTDELETKDSEDIENFVSERQDLVQQLQGIMDVQKMNSLQKEELKRILSYDLMIQERILLIKNEAQEWLLQRNLAKTQRSLYETKYVSESYLMDKRK
ncbi:hypothetical protein NST33_28105 [Paenibacillus sp. FSL L8-0435]|uniref:hypothetical protein n=1 Tax=Paenibacillus TaxID=44249 RepID=UPI001C8F1B7B|nr:hypothetical protein [Paenibacillus xylanexedens]MBY0118839.1 hypothetical protein [Paenibacillus xylanexedens]